MNRDNVIEQLENKSLPLKEVQAIFESFKADMQIVGMVAMNLSLRTSVYDRDQGADPIMTELLIALSEVEDMGSRWAVAKNPHTPQEVLEKLSRDGINLVRALVATNPNTPIDALNRLFSDEKIVRDGLSGNPNTPAKLLKVLADDVDKMVRLRVAENAASTQEVLQKLSHDNDADVAKASQLRLEA